MLRYVTKGVCRCDYIKGLRTGGIILHYLDGPSGSSQEAERERSAIDEGGGGMMMEARGRRGAREEGVVAASRREADSPTELLGRTPLPTPWLHPSELHFGLPASTTVRE